MINCLNWRKLLTSIGQLSALQTLIWTNFSFQEIFTSIGQLTTLQNLNLSRHLRLQELPTSIGHLSAFKFIQKLSFLRVFELAKLTYLYWLIQCIIDLHLSRCLSLHKILTSIGELNALQNLKSLIKCRL